MGGAAETVSRVAAGIGTGGLSEIENIPGTGKTGSDISRISRNFSVLNPGPWFVGAAARTGAGINTIANAPRDAARSAQALNVEQQRQAAAAEQRLLQQPKNISPDNFLAMKNRMLQNMRLGLLATVPGGGGAPSPVLSAPSLTGSGPGKVRLGS